MHRPAHLRFVALATMRNFPLARNKRPSAAFDSPKAKRGTRAVVTVTTYKIVASPREGQAPENATLKTQM